MFRSKAVSPPRQEDGTVRIVDIPRARQAGLRRHHLASTGRARPVRILKVDNKGPAEPPESGSASPEADERARLNGARVGGYEFGEPPRASGGEFGSGPRMSLDASVKFALPDDAERALLVGRVWRADVGRARPSSSCGTARSSTYRRPRRPCAISSRRTIRPASRARLRARASARSRRFSRRARGRAASRACPGCSRRSTCRRSRRRASPSPSRMLERVIEEQARGAPGAGGRDPCRDRGADRRRSRQAQARLASRRWR